MREIKKTLLPLEASERDEQRAFPQSLLPCLVLAYLMVKVLMLIIGQGDSVL